MKKQTTALLISLAVVVLLAGLLIFLMVRFQSEEDQTDCPADNKWYRFRSYTVCCSNRQ